MSYIFTKLRSEAKWKKKNISDICTDPSRCWQSVVKGDVRVTIKNMNRKGIPFCWQVHDLDLIYKTPLIDLIVTYVY